MTLSTSWFCYIFVQVEEKYMTKPSSYLKIPGNKIRLQGIQDYCVNKQQQQRDRDSREKFKREIVTGSQRKNERSRSPAKMKQITEADEKKLKTKLQETIQKQVHKLNVISTQKVALENPDVVYNLTGEKNSATVTCLACDKSCKDRTCTAYAKGTSWIVMNYKRHLERVHLNAVISSKSNGSLDKFIQRKQIEESTEKETAEDITISVDPSIFITDNISDDEEESLRNTLEKNFLRKE